MTFEQQIVAKLATTILAARLNNDTYMQHLHTGQITLSEEVSASIRIAKRIVEEASK